MREFLFRFLFPKEYYQLKRCKNSINEMYSHVWDNFLAKDSKGRTCEKRNKNETIEHWSKLHNMVR